MASFVFTGSATTGGLSGINYPINTYVPLDDLRSYFSLASNNTTDDETLKGFIRDASRNVDHYTRRHFYPKKETRYYNLPDGDCLRFDRDFISITGLSDMGGASEIDSADYWLTRGEDWNLRPYDRLVLNDSRGTRFNYSDTTQRAVVLEGITGFHESNGWLSSGTSAIADMTVGTGWVNVGGSLGQDANGQSPRFKVGETIKIDDEFMMIQQGSGLSNIGVQRGLNGTTIASHASNTAVFVWKPESDIVFYTKRLASWAYMQSQSPYTERISVPGYGSIDVPGTWPKDILRGLKRFKRPTIKKVY
jgi:hypothetical protein